MIDVGLRLFAGGQMKKTPSMELTLRYVQAQTATALQKGRACLQICCDAPT
jgi:hypothetical protein